MTPASLLHTDPRYRHAPSTGALLEEAECTLSIRFPADYRAFLLSSEGYDGPVGTAGHDVYLWPLATIVRREYDGPAEAGVLLIGSNGGPTGYGIVSAAPDQFVSMPLASADHDELRPLGTSFQEFLQAVADGHGW